MELEKAGVRGTSGTEEDMFDDAFDQASGLEGTAGVSSELENKEEEIDVGDDLEITKTTRRNAGSGSWVIGSLNNHKFEALVFPIPVLLLESLSV